MPPFPKYYVDLTPSTRVASDNTRVNTPNAANDIVARRLYKQQLQERNQGTIKASGPRQSIVSKAVDVALNPMTAAKYAINKQRLPDNFALGDRNILDYATDLFNPAFYANQGKELLQNTGEGLYNLGTGNGVGAWNNLTGAGLNALAVLPVAGEIAPLTRATSKYITTQTPLRNAYKYNPWAWKPNSEAYYRMLGETGIDDALQSGVIRASENPVGNVKYTEPYFSKSYPLDSRTYNGRNIKGNYKGPGMVEVVNEPFNTSFPKSEYVATPINELQITNPNVKLYNQDWLRGYKKINIPTNKGSNTTSLWEGFGKKPSIQLPEGDSGPLVYEERVPVDGVYRKRVVITDPNVKDDIIGLGPQPIVPINPVQYPEMPPVPSTPIKSYRPDDFIYTIHRPVSKDEQIFNSFVNRPDRNWDRITLQGDELKHYLSLDEQAQNEYIRNYKVPPKKAYGGEGEINNNLFNQIFRNKR